MKKVNNSIPALVNLLEDEDEHISTTAMQQILSSENQAEKIIAEYQESHNPILRNRVHQMGNILKLRRTRSTFIENVRNSSLSMWDGILQVNYQYNPLVELKEIQEIFLSLVKRLPKRITLQKLAEFMRSEKFTFSGENILNADMYLISDVLLQRTGSPVLLSVIFRELATISGISTNVVIINGKHCLVNDDYHYIEPSNDWRISHLIRGQTLHRCDKTNIWLTVLSQLFISSMLEGQPLTIFRVGSILAELCEGQIRNLPFPLGS